MSRSGCMHANLRPATSEYVGQLSRRPLDQDSFDPTIDAALVALPVSTLQARHTRERGEQPCEVERYIQSLCGMAHGYIIQTAIRLWVTTG